MQKGQFKKRIRRLHEAVELADAGSSPKFRVFFDGQTPLTPSQRGTNDVYFQMPAPLPVPEELLERKQ